MGFVKEAADTLKVAARRIINIAKPELKEQGHQNTGRLDKSFEVRLLQATKSRISVGVFFYRYGIVLNEGVPSSRIPFTVGGPRRGGKSKYIEGLIAWARTVKPGTIKQRRAFAFAVATKAKKEKGHPTTGSFVYSKNGRRKRWMDAVQQEAYGQSDALLINDLRKNYEDDLLRSIIRIENVTISNT